MSPEAGRETEPGTLRGRHESGSRTSLQIPDPSPSIHLLVPITPGRRHRPRNGGSADCVNTITFFPKPGHLVALHPKGHGAKSSREGSGSDGGINSSSLQTVVFANSDLTGSSGAHQEVSLIGHRCFEAILAEESCRREDSTPGSPSSKFTRPSTQPPGAHAS